MQNKNLEELKEEADIIDIQTTIRIGLRNWYWFATSIIICFLIAFLYLKSKNNLYQVKATILIKDDHSRGGGSTRSVDGLHDFFDVYASFMNSAENEIYVLQTKKLIAQTLSETHQFIRYSLQETLREKPLYKNTPIKVYIKKEEEYNIKKTIHLLITKTEQGYTLRYGYHLDDDSKSLQIVHLPTFITFKKKTIYLEATGEGKLKVGDRLHVSLQNPQKMAKGLLGSFNAAPIAKKTAVIGLTYTDLNKRRGEDFLNKLIHLYNKNANLNMNKVAERSREFISTQLAQISKELNFIENEKENYKKDRGVIDAKTNANLSLQNSTDYTNRIVESSTQLTLIQEIEHLINDETQIGKPYPTNIGLNNTSLTQQIEKYNEIALTYNEIRTTATEKNPAALKIKAKLMAQHRAIQIAVKQLINSLVATTNQLQLQSSKYQAKVIEAPTYENDLKSINRIADIKSRLYMILLEKKAENSIAIAATAERAQVLDDAEASEAPISPKKKLILMIALVIGTAIPAGILYLMQLLNSNIQSIDDFKSSSLNLLGSLPYIPNFPEKIIKKGDNNTTCEAFRRLRTRLIFQTKEENEKVILVTSTKPNEGKSFTASNLASSFSFLKKKTVLVGLDFYHPHLREVFNVENKEHKGVSDFLLNEHLHLDEITQKINNHLDLITTGVSFSYAEELLALPRLKMLFTILREHYDYIIVDSSPIGIITDAMMIGDLVDRTVYLLKANYTEKETIKFIEKIAKSNEVPNISIVLNGTKRNHNYSPYGYNYGYGYSYYYTEKHERKKRFFRLKFKNRK